MAWERVVVQDGTEVVYEGDTSVGKDADSGSGPDDRALTKGTADKWLAWKRESHAQAGWTIVDGVDSFTATKVYEGGKTRTRTFLIRST